MAAAPEFLVNELARRFLFFLENVVKNYIEVWVPGGRYEFKLREGETEAGAMARLRLTKIERMSTASQERSKPVASKTAAVGSREWAACLVHNFGPDKGSWFIARELTYDEARAEASAEHAKLAGRAAERGGDAPPNNAHGFASKIRVIGGLQNPLKKK